MGRSSRDVSVEEQGSPVLTRGRRLVAVLVVVAMPLVSVSLVATCVERPFWPMARRASKSVRGAVAIRDNVIPFQKWGTRAFTVPYLDRCYERVVYLTRVTGDDKRDAFVDAVRSLAMECETVDVFLLAHGNQFVGWASTLDAATTGKLRLVYDTGCGDVTQASRWIGLGAKAYVGHVGLSASPVFYVYFLRRWSAGWSLDRAVDAANEETAGLLRETWVFGVAPDAIEGMIIGSRAELSGTTTLQIETP